ncbi:YciI family protein [Prosthecomicrobium pneumaticum]|uniref:YCII-related domain-containing protein n=1 Tax=Prosthecomicrobium pneumaticum TaxID=81895 RepID=A0A7W9L2G5_9HYPH|nr:YciI family protein [Prosthecomicrobium pneumaticum]MBB5753471.1 hypothetical protein [Prosthecomicrobium pneumaticum]
MHFVALCEDKPNGLSLRTEVRPVHLDYLKTVPIRIAGPFLAEDGETMVGTLYVIEADSLAEAQKIVDEDPFTKAGLFSSVTVRPWRWGIGKPA